jgi:hypothetical protein
LRGIAVHEHDDASPYWYKHYVGDLDAAMLYGVPSLTSARTYLEIGSGNTTRFIRRGIEDHGADIRIVSIDPAPRTEIDRLCDQVHRMPLEQAPLSVFEELQSGDVVAFDGSHRCFQNTDVAVFFLEILPRLPRGVVIFIHDIFLPSDYPSDWSDRHYSEQYLLAVLLMADRGRRYEVLFPAYFATLDPPLREAMDRLWTELAIPGLPRGVPSGFWMCVR